MTEERKKIVVVVKEGASTSEVCERLEAVGVEDTSKLEHIGCVLGAWAGSLQTLQELEGVDSVEEESSDYFPNEEEGEGEGETPCRS